MARTALTAPNHVVAQRNALGNLNQQPDSAPSLTYGGGIGLQDSRLPFNKYNNVGQGLNTGTAIIGWYDTAMVVNAVPAALAANNIAASQSPGAGAITLVSTSGAGVTVLATPFQAWPSLTTVPVGTLALDGNPLYQKFGLRDRTWFYDQASFLARNVRITSGGNDSGITFTVSGYDVYGYAQTETITGMNGAAIATTGASGTGTTATITFGAQTSAYPVGATIVVAGVTPAGYNGTYTVTASTTTSVSYANATTGAQTVAGTVQQTSPSAGRKTFKWVSGVTHTGTVAGTVTIGTGDVFGFPIRSDSFGYTYIVYAGNSITSTTGFTPADTTNPATSTTGDVRGTYALQTPSNGTNRLEVGITLNIAGLNVTPISNGIFGVPTA